ncbi:hypothetical protein BC940DRAFT_354320 [Gongronella butleri]|nr:hypothetical protein BC940DRAFT_354320 [Gongronella butleri]
MYIVMRILIKTRFADVVSRVLNSQTAILVSIERPSRREAGAPNDSVVTVIGDQWSVSRACRVIFEATRDEILQKEQKTRKRFALDFLVPIDLLEAIHNLPYANDKHVLSIIANDNDCRVIVDNHSYDKSNHIMSLVVSRDNDTHATNLECAVVAIARMYPRFSP